MGCFPKAFFRKGKNKFTGLSTDSTENGSMRPAAEPSSSSPEAPKESAGSSNGCCNSSTKNSNGNTNSSNGHGGHDLVDEDEGLDVCRICMDPGDVDNPLQCPCACSGSIKFVHQDCLLQWLNHSNPRKCQVCKHPYSFSPVSTENALARPSFQEFVVGKAMKACRIVQFLFCLSLILSVWLFINPFITFWIWRLAFIRGFGRAQRLFLGHLSPTAILTDCLHGFPLSATIVIIFLEASTLRSYFRLLQEIRGDRNGARAGRRRAARVNRIIAVDGNGVGGAGKMIQWNAKNVAMQLDRLIARVEARVRKNFDELMQGTPDLHLAGDAFLVLASNTILLGVIIFVPFWLGRIFLYSFSWLLTSATVMPVDESALSLANIALKNALNAVVNFTLDKDKKSLLRQVIEILKVNRILPTEVSSNTSSTIAMDSHLSDLTILAAGYTFVFSLVVFYFGTVALIQYFRGVSLRNSTLAKTISYLFRQLIAEKRHLMTMIRVAFILIIELGISPLLCGWWLDLCTIKMFGKSISHRVEFCSVSPVACSLDHWIAGLGYMVLISIILRLLRLGVRDGVLRIFQVPNRINDPFRNLIDDPLHKHVGRVLLFIPVYGSLTVVLVFLPMQLAMRMIPSVFPLDSSDPFTEIPNHADCMILFQLCLSFPTIILNYDILSNLFIGISLLPLAGQLV